MPSLLKHYREHYKLVLFLSLGFMLIIAYFTEQRISRHLYIQYNYDIYPNSNVTIRETSKCENMSKFYKILIWSNTYNVFPFYKKIFQKDKIPNSCPSCKCQFTTNKSEITTSEVLVFSLLNLEEGFPNYRSPDQIWAVYNDEAPQRTRNIKMSHMPASPPVSVLGK